MKRSAINHSIGASMQLLEKNNFRLPDFAYFSFKEWMEKKNALGMIQHTMLGWDVTDFGNGDFENMGGVLFTIRNGDVNDVSFGTPYAEKLIIMTPKQRLPVHMHPKKTEDIINRGGGNFEIKLYNAAKDGNVDFDTPVNVFCDGMKRTVGAGETLKITKGNSITLTPYMYHTFWCSEDGGPVIIGEVSSVNDDNTDNVFAEEVCRFSILDEDEPAEWILCNEYGKLLKWGCGCDGLDR